MGETLKLIEEHIKDLENRFNDIQGKVKEENDKIAAANKEIAALNININYCQGEYQALAKMKAEIEQKLIAYATEAEVTDVPVEEVIEVVETEDKKKRKFGRK